jgi:hypothetical protein
VAAYVSALGPLECSDVSLPRAAHVEKLVAKYQWCQRRDAGKLAHQRHLHRHVSYVYDGSGDFVLIARLPRGGISHRRGAKAFPRKRLRAAYTLLEGLGKGGKSE